MRSAPFQYDDLEEYGALLERSRRVIPMCEVADGDHAREAVGLRHDVDNLLAPAVAMAQWEADRGFRSTYFVLHTAPYWQEKDTLQAGLEAIAECGHEIGFHINAITEAIRTGRDPLEIAQEAVAELRGYGYEVRGVVAHGDQACYDHGFVNDELFTESARPKYGAADREVGGIQLRPVSRTALGFDYDPNWLSRGNYISDSGGTWSQPFAGVAEGWPYEGQLHMLVHPCWWSDALIPVAVEA